MLNVPFILCKKPTKIKKQALRYKYKGVFKKCIFAFLSPRDL